MKIINYKPLIDLPAIQEASETIPVEVFSEVIFQNTSLEDALEELRREGYEDSSGRKVLPGIRDLLQHIKEIREALSAESDGPVKSGVSSHKGSPDGSARTNLPRRRKYPWPRQSICKSSRSWKN